MAVFPIRTLEIKTDNKVSVLEAVESSHWVKTGFVCSSDKDIVCIDGLCNRENKFWTIEVNGNYEDFNSRSEIGPSDRLVLKYASSREK